jgi:hypothetical protein
MTEINSFLLRMAENKSDQSRSDPEPVVKISDPDLSPF